MALFVSVTLSIVELLYLFAVLGLFAFGSMIGSFLNVLIYRTVHNENYVRGRSHCPNCQVMIAWYDNIPLVSFVLLGGKCRHCTKPISKMYPIVEAMTGALFVWWGMIGFAFFQLTSTPLMVLQPLFWLLVGIGLIVVFFADIRYMEIPDEAVIGLTLLASLYRTLLWKLGIMPMQDYLFTLYGALGVAGFFWLLWLGTKRKGIGFGDVKFAFPFGLILGFPNVLVGLLLAFVLGAVVGVSLVLAGKTQMGARLPFGPFLVTSAVITLLFGDLILRWYLSLM